MLNLNEKKKIANEILKASSACPEIKAAAEAYLEASVTANSSDAGKALVTEAKDCISDIDSTIGFFSTDTAKEIFGAELAAEKLAHAKHIKSEGAKYCDCPGCTAALKVIENEESFR
ncbi:MAG: molecular chaperone Hsp90 [Clostridia bacterium]|nr:molecular chaperone Hsp90 [Clostridia bacterium]